MSFNLITSCFFVFVGMIWALQKGGEVFCFPPDSRKPHLVEPPVGISFKQLSAAPEAVWGLDDKGGIFIRMGVSEMHPHGVVWKKLDLNQLGKCLNNSVYSRSKTFSSLPLLGFPPSWAPSPF